MYTATFEFWASFFRALFCSLLSANYRRPNPIALTTHHSVVASLFLKPFHRRLVPHISTTSRYSPAVISAVASCHFHRLQLPHSTNFRYSRAALFTIASPLQLSLYTSLRCPSNVPSAIACVFRRRFSHSPHPANYRSKSILVAPSVRLRA